MRRRIESRPIKLFASGLMIATSVVIGLLMSEAMVRIVSPQPVSVQWQGELHGLRAAAPNVRGRLAVPHTFDTRISINSQRFRGTREYTPLPASGTLRIAALGDSYTFGWGVNDNETYPARLEDHLNSRLRAYANSHVEVINAGNAGSGTGEEVLFYAMWVAQFRPNVVILNVHANDVDDDLSSRFFEVDADGNARPRGKPESAESRIRRFTNAIPFYSYLAERSQLLQLVRQTYARIRAAKNSETIVTDETFVNTGIPMLRAEIRLLNDQVQKAGSRLVVTFLPPEWWIENNSVGQKWKSEVIVKALAEECRNAGIPFIDVTPEVRVQEAENTNPLYYRIRDVHPTATGYDVFAVSVCERLLAQAVVPGAPTPGFRIAPNDR